LEAIVVVKPRNKSSDILNGIVLATASIYIQLADEGLCISKHIVIWKIFPAKILQKLRIL
jgi:hypothetical protein